MFLVIAALNLGDSFWLGRQRMQQVPQRGGAVREALQEIAQQAIEQRFRAAVRASGILWLTRGRGQGEGGDDM